MRSTARSTASPLRRARRHAPAAAAGASSRMLELQNEREAAAAGARWPCSASRTRSRDRSSWASSGWDDCSRRAALWARPQRLRAGGGSTGGETLDRFGRGGGPLPARPRRLAATTSSAAREYLDWRYVDSPRPYRPGGRAGGERPCVGHRDVHGALRRAVVPGRARRPGGHRALAPAQRRARRPGPGPRRADLAGPAGPLLAARLRPDAPLDPLHRQAAHGRASGSPTGGPPGTLTLGDIDFF